MQIIDLIIILAIGALIYRYFLMKTNEESETQQEKEIWDNFEDEKSLHIKKKKTHKDKNLENPYVLDTQFHNDYRDTINAFQILLPQQKQLFNRGNVPLTKVTVPETEEIKPFVKNFIKEVNKTLDKHVKNEYIAKDWKNNYSEKKYDDGWAKQQEKIGIPGSIHSKPAEKTHIELVKVKHAEKRETEDEIQYIIYLIVKKTNVDDQMSLKVSFQCNKQDYDIERDFFDKGKNTYETLVKIEDIYVEGYLTKSSLGNHSVKAQYHNFDGITDGRMFSQQDILKELNKKRKQYEIECIS